MAHCFHRLTPYAKQTLQLLTARGIHFVFATGRHHVDVAQMRANLEIDAYMITSNGARVHNQHRRRTDLLPQF